MAPEKPRILDRSTAIPAASQQGAKAVHVDVVALHGRVTWPGPTWVQTWVQACRIGAFKRRLFPWLRRAFRQTGLRSEFSRPGLSYSSVAARLRRRGVPVASLRPTPRACQVAPTSGRYTERLVGEGLQHRPEWTMRRMRPSNKPPMPGRRTSFGAISWEGLPLRPAGGPIGARHNGISPGLRSRRSGPRSTRRPCRQGQTGVLTLRLSSRSRHAAEPRLIQAPVGRDIACCTWLRAQATG